MKFWDTSALVSLLLEEPATASTQALYDEDPELLVWWATPVECMSALSRCERDKSEAPDAINIAMQRLRALAENWNEILPAQSVRRHAERLVRSHPLRAADALQLAAAVVAAEVDPWSLPFVCLDRRLAAAALKEGFLVPVL